MFTALRYRRTETDRQTDRGGGGLNNMILFNFDLIYGVKGRMLWPNINAHVSPFQKLHVFVSFICNYLFKQMHQGVFH